MRRAAGSDWPRVLCPAPGCLPPIAPPRAERVLFVALRSAIDDYDAHPHCLSQLAAVPSDYRKVSVALDSIPDAEALAAAAALRPTLVFLWLQRESMITAEVVDELRRLCAPDAAIVHWDGDQHHEPADPGRRWFVELGRACDASLVVNTKHPAEYAAMGVRHPGFLLPAIDQKTWRPTAPTPGTAPIVCLANRWPALDYAARDRHLARVAAAFPGQLAVHGRGWTGAEPFPTRPFLPNAAEAGTYSAARAALSISIRCDLPRYTSNRLFYALASGAVVLAERFPDCEGLGLEDGRDCLLWSGWSELRAHLERVLRARPEAWRAMRAAARAAGLLHGLPIFLGELSAIVAAVREDRRG